MTRLENVTFYEFVELMQGYLGLGLSFFFNRFSKTPIGVLVLLEKKVEPIFSLRFRSTTHGDLDRSQTPVYFHLTFHLNNNNNNSNSSCNKQ